MYAPKGYTPLSELWMEFVKLRHREIYSFACETYLKPEFIGTALYGVPDEFGSPKDLVEQTLIETVRAHKVTICRADGNIASLPTNLADGSSDIFERALVFESTIIGEELSGTDEGRDWLTRMGSIEFSAWPHKLGKAKLWAEAYSGPNEEADIDKLWDTCRYHRLPMWFERHRFVIPQSLPPWTSDAADVAFAKSTAPNFLGWSICLDEYSAKKWRSENIRGNAYLAQFGQIPSHVKKLGRPLKREKALRAYDQIYPEGNHASWKAATAAIHKKFGIEVGEQTLQRAINARNETRQN